MSYWLRIIAVRMLIASLIVLAAHASLAQAGSPLYPQRIVSLAPSVTESLFALGFGPRLVGVTTYCDYPAEAKKLPKIGGFMSPSLEVIVAAIGPACRLFTGSVRVLLVASAASA